jgi:GNAT superfamily N-acetyltransferase
MAGFTIRPATQGDLDALRGIFRRASLTNEGDRDSLLASPEALDWDGDRIDEGRTRVAVDEDGRLLGFATVVDVEGGRELEDLFVDPDAMRRGVATELVADAVLDANRAGARWIEVTGNEHAAAFYASVGFRRVGEQQTRFRPAPRLRLDLDEARPGSGR